MNTPKTLTPTPLMMFHARQLEQELNEALYTASEMAREAVLLRQALDERKQELNDAKLWIEKSNTAQYAMQLEAERDQLRKVCDWFSTSVVNRNLYGDKSAIAHYNSLPHVKERNAK
jgi:hypothetical protein